MSSRPTSLSSDYSIVSSFDTLSLSSSSSTSYIRHAPSIDPIPPHARRASSSSSIQYIRPRPISYISSSTTSSGSCSSDGYEMVIPPHREQRSTSISLSMMEATSSSASSSSSVNGETADGSEVSAGTSGTGKMSKSAARRDRRKKLQAGEKERAALAAGGEVGMGGSEDGMEDDGDLASQTPRPNRTLPTSHKSSSDPSSTLPSTSDPFNETGIEGPRRRKTRRGGKAAKRRAEHALQKLDDAEVDNELFANTTCSTTPSISGTGTPIRAVSQQSRYSNTARPSHIYEDDEEVDGEEDEVDALSALESEIGTPVSARTREMSVMSVEDATSSIDSFLSDPRNFMTIKANKLRLWQSLCVELGLVHMQTDDVDDDDSPDLPTDISGSPTSHLGDDILSPVKSKPLPRPNTHPLPQTLTQARKLLKDHAHVNLVDYLEARRLCPPAYVGAYQGLLHPSVSAMKRYTRKEGKFAVKGMVKVEWLEPLMRDFTISRAA
ncbi:hypothetical protein CI109_101130 [Kwoniella shandongensis]|uniref:Uncharacterized protein n=1 Tax=Kwoniella shandongensis TaxID=1734106 RepID=A0A5M6C5B4_9TREE|nr:uncharacterized protein CI109_001600 [Kwoniella shandongensis]KAA5530193.1 hypothetical protein CI109_001600 [Kwoniella shandongensis]